MTLEIAIIDEDTAIKEDEFIEFDERVEPGWLDAILESELDAGELAPLLVDLSPAPHPLRRLTTKVQLTKVFLITNLSLKKAAKK